MEVDMAIDFSRPLDPEIFKDLPPGPLITAPLITEAPPPAVTAFDLATVRLALAPYKVQIDGMVAQAKAIQITDDASQVVAVELGTTARKLKNQVEALRKSTVQPFNDHVKDVNNLAKSFTEPLDTAERDLKAKISTFQTKLRIEQQKKEAEAREAARKVQEAYEAEQRAIREEAARKAREAEEALKKEKDAAARAALKRTIAEEKEAAEAPIQVAVAPVIPEIPKAVRTESGSAHQRMTWTFEIEDGTKVPRAYLAIDEQKIRQAVKAGIRQIPGVRIFEQASTTFR
jgi:hypothetical protein